MARSLHSSVEITQTGMCRVTMSFLIRSSTRQPSRSGRTNIEGHCSGLVLPDQAKARSAERSNQALESSFTRRVEQESGEPEIVFDDQEDLVIR